MTWLWLFPCATLATAWLLLVIEFDPDLGEARGRYSDTGDPVERAVVALIAATFTWPLFLPLLLVYVLFLRERPRRDGRPPL